MEGTVKWYQYKKEFGFISGDDGADYFVHKSALADGVKSLREGDKVSFEAVDTQKGKQAQNVKLLQKASESGATSYGKKPSKDYEETEEEY